MFLGVCLHNVRNTEQRKEHPDRPKTLTVKVVVNNNYIENVLLLRLMCNSEIQIHQQYVGYGFTGEIHLTYTMCSHDLSRSTRDC